MDNHIFRSALSGFNRQDVMEYIERTQKQAEEAARRRSGMRKASSRRTRRCRLQETRW